MTANSLSFLNLPSFQIANSTILRQSLSLTSRRSTNQSFYQSEVLHSNYLTTSFYLIEQIYIEKLLCIHIQPCLLFDIKEFQKQIKNKQLNKIKILSQTQNIQLVFFKIVSSS
ncbi:hypothetical protein ABPG72_001637 [Tetrahymena utriculariae]